MQTREMAAEVSLHTQTVLPATVGWVINNSYAGVVSFL